MSLKLKTLSVIGIMSALHYLPSSASPEAPAMSSVSRPSLHTLPNGLRIIVKEDHSAPVASVQFWVETGSIHEDEWMGAGLSHILEHMLFKGTETRSGRDIVRGVQDQGGYVNAYTSFDRTVYLADVPSAGVAEVIDILADIVLNATLPEDEYAKEQEVIRREFAMGFDSPERTGQKLLFETAFSEHPYRHPVIGYLDVYNRLTRQDVMDYYRERYVPNNMFVVVVGDVDTREVVDQISGIFADVPRRALGPVTIPGEPRQLGKRERHEEFPTELSRLAMAWKIPGVTSPDMPALDVLASILGEGRSSRLYRSVRSGQGLVHTVDTFAYTPSGHGLFAVLATTDPDKRVAAERAIHDQIRGVRQDGVTREEVDKARKQILSDQFASMKTMSGQASDLGGNWLLARNLDFTGNYLDALSRVTPEDVRRVAREYLVDDGLTITSLNPPGAAGAGEAKEVAGEAAGEIRKFELPNGLRLLVRRDTRLPLVSLTATLRGGTLAESPEQSGLSTLLAATMLKGTETRDADAIADAIESVGGSITSDSGRNSLSVAVETMSSDWRLGLDILSDVVLNPVFPAEVVEREKAVQVAAIKNDNEQPVRLASNVLREHLYGDHPYAKPLRGDVEAVSGFTSEDLGELHGNLVDARNAVIAVFGDVDPVEVRDAVAQAFEGMPSGSGAALDVPAVGPLDGDREVREPSDKEQAVLMIGYLGPTMDDPDRLALEVINEASSDMGSRFFEAIREDLGLAYFVGSSMTPGLARGLFGFYLGTDPEKTGLVERTLLAEIGELAERGLTEDEFRRARAKIEGQQKIKLQANDEFARLAALNELYGLGYDHHETELERLERITLDEVNEVARRVFGGQHHVNVLVSPRVGAGDDAADARPSREEE